MGRRGKARRGAARRERSRRATAPAPTEREEARASKGWAPHLIAIFVVFHALANCAGAIPNVSLGLDRAAWRDPRVVRELEVWSDRLGVERSELEPQLYALTVEAHGVREVVRAPFDPYLRAMGIRQSWLMFSAGTRESVRFGVHVRRCTAGCEWELIYLHGDPAHAWRARQLGHPRVRSGVFRWGWPSARASYERGCRVIAALAFEDHANVRAVRCAFEWSVTPSPDAPDRVEPTWRSTRVVRR